MARRDPAPDRTAAAAKPAPTAAKPAPAFAAAPKKSLAAKWWRVLVWVRRIAEVGAALAAFGATLLWCTIPSVTPLATGNPTTTAFIELRRAEAADAGRPFALEWKWTRFEKISPYLRGAVVYAEDIDFWKHGGVDWGAIEDAAEATLEGGSGRGGSTITQQLAKNLYLSPSRSVTRKLREFMITYRLEDALDKKRILELYLNVAEWGDGVFGAEAAARHWFHRSAAALTPAQAVRLAVALPNPRLRSPGHRLSPADRKKCDRLLRWMRHEGLIGASEMDAARGELGLGRGDATPNPTTPVAQPDEPPVPVPASPGAAPPSAAPPSAAPSSGAQPVETPPSTDPATTAPPVAPAPAADPAPATSPATAP
jgi:monofunctional biosynthetic peptidoglycan transglycosylase